MKRESEVLLNRDAEGFGEIGNEEIGTRLSTLLMDPILNVTAFCQVPAMDKHAMAIPGKLMGSCPADAIGGACYQNGFSFHT